MYLLAIIVLEAPISMAPGPFISFYFIFFSSLLYFSPFSPSRPIFSYSSHSLEPPQSSPIPLLQVPYPPLLSPLVGWLPWSSLNRELDAELDHDPGR